ncbi:MAG: accessory Sec system translocase SecA2 [Firmicutes bacterium]|nr:accessory Sec system translocase SecA2 [Bacillota bacterium]
MTNNTIYTQLKENTATETRHAIIKNVIQELTGLSLFDTQLRTARSLQHGKIAELPTGEGKTLAAVVAAICYALDGRRVHVLVFNDYLAKRDFTDNKAIYEACGITVGFVDQHSTIQQRKSAYACDVTYVAAKQAGFDYLRGFLAQSMDEVTFPGFDVAIVDEADSIMIDECTTPLVLAGEMPFDSDADEEIDKCIQSLADDCYEASHTEHKVWLTDKGLEHVENYLGVALHDEENLHILSSVQCALAAYYLLARDKDYIIKDGCIRLVEPTTGRVILNKRYPALLHRALEVKEGVMPTPFTMIYNSVTMQNFLRLYKVLCGMTGTAATSAGEFESTYDLSVDVIPPNSPCIRVDHQDVFFMDRDEFYQSIIGQVRDCNSRKQPVLIGTKSVAESELFSQMLDKANIPHYVLNAKNDEEEAKLIAKAGEPGRVTISTNMAGRGVDIRLGDGAAEAGGLYVISVGVNHGERIDNQLRGRAGRQGDVGESKFFIWLEDTDLSYRMTPLEKVKAEIGSTKRRISTVRRIQRAMEGEAARIRSSMNRFAKIVEAQRLRITELRTEILKGNKYFAILEKGNPDKYRQVLQQAGLDGIKRAEQQLALFFINKHWARLVETLENARSGIHFISLRDGAFSTLIGEGQSDALDEYVRIVIRLCDEMSDNLRQDILKKMEELPITKDGVDMGEAGLNGGTTTWTYAIDESAHQFNRLTSIIKSIRGKFSGEDGILTKYYRKKRDNIKTQTTL